MFDAIAKNYDLLNRVLSLRQDQRWRKHLISRIPFRNYGRFLDVATGTGDVLLQAATKRNEYSQYVGVDISESMLDVARKKLAYYADKVVFKNMSACDLQFDDNAFHCLTISFGLRNVKDKPLAIKEFYRCLKPGGTLLVLEFFRSPKSFQQKCFDFYFQKILPRIGGLVSDRAAYEYLPKSVGEFYTIEELNKVALEIGFTPIHSKSFLFGTCGLVELKK